MDAENDKVSPPKDADRLQHLLLMDTWVVHAGLMEIVRDQMPLLSRDDAMAGLNLHGQLQKLWDSGSHSEKAYAPAYFVQWARAKRRPLSWEPWAIQEGYFQAKETTIDLAAERSEKAAKTIQEIRDLLSPPPVSVQLPYINKTLVAVFSVMESEWGNCTPGRIPKQVNVARAIDEALGNPTSFDRQPSRMASSLATAIQPDEIKAADKRRNQEAG